jgi:hypothetical protein
MLGTRNGNENKNEAKQPHEKCSMRNLGTQSAGHNNLLQRQIADLRIKKAR